MKDNKALKYLTLITGVLTLLLGVYTLVRPMRTFLAIGWILGILLFVNGIELVILSLSKEKKEIGACILVFSVFWKDLQVLSYYSAAFSGSSQT